ncbi:hypothetical protein, partial [Nocardia sp.]|uniref:hypothetical protein n=1 Tax=Nocardia sp. TaxID=1821 RepID=UPI0026307A35
LLFGLHRPFPDRGQQIPNLIEHLVRHAGVSSSCSGSCTRRYGPEHPAAGKVPINGISSR